MGVGLLGGSVGLACPAAGLTAVRVGIGRRRASLNRALRYDAVDEITLSFARGLKGAQLVVLATPIGKFEPLLEKMAPHLEPGTVVTDVGSTKAHVVGLAKRLLPAHCRFVGSHPVAGSEQTGVEYARADLFDGAVVFVTPTRSSGQVATRLVRDFWRVLGARVRTLTPEQHDDVLGRVSHLPHALASLLICTTADSLDAAGPGMIDTTRIASGDPGLWRDIFGTNRRPVINALDDFARQLRQFRQLLAADDRAGIERLLAAAKRRRDRWITRKVARKEMPS